MLTTSAVSTSPPAVYPITVPTLNLANYNILSSQNGTLTVTGAAPSISCPLNISVNNTTGQCGANVTFAATDNVGNPASTITYSPASGSFFPVGTTTVTATATNAIGNSVCTFTVTVVDNQVPTITCAPDVTINITPGQCTGTTTLTPPTVTDNCGNSLNFDGVNDYVSIPNGGGLNNLQSGTIEMWVKWNGNNLNEKTGLYGAIIARQSNNVFSNQVIGLNGSDPSTAKIVWRPYDFYSNALTSSVSPGNGWNHLAIVYRLGNHLFPGDTELVRALES